MNITTAISLVENNVSSIFTKQDVLELLKRIESEGEPTGNSFTDEQLSDLIDTVRFDMSMSVEAGDIVDFDSAKFELDGCVLELKDIDIETGPVEDVVEDTIRQWFDRNVF